MSFRTKLFLVFMVTVLGSVSVVAYGVTRYTSASFEEMDTQRTEAIVFGRVRRREPTGFD